MIRRKELTTLIVNVITAKMVLTFPKLLITNSGNAAYLQAIYNTVAAYLLFLITSRLYRGKKNVIELADISGGKALKVVIGVIVFAALMANFASVIRIFPDTIKTVLLQDINPGIIRIIFMTAIGIGAFIGIESIARVNFLILPLIGGVLAAFLVFLIPYYRIYNILPVLGNGWEKILLEGFNTLSLYSDILLLNILLPRYENTSEAKKSGRRAVFISAAVIVSILLAHCLVYPYPASEEFMIPIYQLTRMIHLSNFFSRFEAVFQFAWSILLLLYASIYVYALCYVWQTTFNLKFYRPLIIPVTLISGVVSLIQTESLGIVIVYPIAFLLPLIFGIVSRRYYGEKS